jgi:hypothetical protein
MKRDTFKFIKEYGEIEDYKQFADIPKKIGSIKAVKIDQLLSCTYCSPHRGDNWRRKIRRNWKKYRKAQYKWI